MVTRSGLETHWAGRFDPKSRHVTLGGEMNMLPFEGYGSGPRAGRRGALILVLLLSVGGIAEAQEARALEPRETFTPIRKGYINLNMARQIGHRALRNSLTRTLYEEPETVHVNRASTPGDLLDAAMGFRVWKNLAIGLGVTYSRTESNVDVTGTVPHPLFYGQYREWQSQASILDDIQIGFHPHMAWTIRLGGRFDVALSAGPSLFRVERDGVFAITTGEVGLPYSEVQVDVDHATLKKNIPGANVGLDLTYHLIRRLEPGALFWTAGIGVFVRWTTATSTFTEFEPDQDIEVGGLQAGAGFRFRF